MSWAWRILGEAAWLTARGDAWRNTWERGAFLGGGLEQLCVCRVLLVVANWFIRAVLTLMLCAGGVTRVLRAPGLCWRCLT